MRHRVSFVESLVILILALCIASVLSDDKTHRYEDGEAVTLWVNKVGPYYNPQETYEYYSLPFCRPEGKAKQKSPSLGEAILGNELVQSSMPMSFKNDVLNRKECSVELTDDVYNQFLNAVSEQYWFQFFIDDLPILGMVGGHIPQSASNAANLFATTTAYTEPAGEGEPVLSTPPTEDGANGDGGDDRGPRTGVIGSGSANEEPFIFTHKKFSIGFNGDRIVEVNLTSDDPEVLVRGKSLTFSYSVEWIASEVAFENRFRRYLDDNFFEHKVHWFSILNSVMMVLFLAGLVFMILMRTLRKDFAKYAKDVDDDFENDHGLGDNSGWKQLYGDVFRPVRRLTLFSALLGTGQQLTLLSLLTIAVAIAGSLYDSRGAVVTALVIIYAFTSFVAGYGSGSYYAQNGGQNWIQTMFVTASLFPGVCCGAVLLLNFVAIAYHSLAAIPFGTMVAVFAIWALVSVPLVLLGTIIGRHAKSSDRYFRINPIPRPIPDKKWYLSRFVIVMAGGVLPFGSIFIEMYFAFTSFASYKYYYVYGFLLLVCLLLAVVILCVTVVSTYFLLNSEDYRWQWTAFFSAGSTALYVFLYAIYYFVYRTQMTGFFQTSFYFGYMAIFCFGLCLLCGSIGFFGSSLFVRKIYQGIKAE